MKNSALRPFQDYPDYPDYPQSIAELNPAQWIHYLMLLSRLQSGEISSEKFKTEWLGYLLKLDVIGYGSLRAKKMMDSEEYNLDGFTLHQNGETRWDTFSLSNNLPQYTWNYTTYTGPQDMCFNLSFGRFLTAYYVYHDYALTQNPIALKYLFAVLYSDGSPMNNRVDSLSNIPQYVALSAYYFFNSVVQHITQKPVYVGGEELPLYRVFEEAAQRSGLSQFGMEETLYEMACNGGVKVNLDDLRRQNLYEVLRYVWFRIKSC